MELYLLNIAGNSAFNFSLDFFGENIHEKLVYPTKLKQKESQTFFLYLCCSLLWRKIMALKKRYIPSTTVHLDIQFINAHSIIQQEEKMILTTEDMRIGI